MEHPLHKLSQSEFGQLFPIIISESTPIWAEIFEIERLKIMEALNPEYIVRIEHIGSTAVPDLLAKPTIDILLEIPESMEDQQIIESLERVDYICLPRPGLPPPHMVFVKGYTLEGFKGQAFHLHVRYPGDWDELYFRDYLIQHPETAREYAALKLKLAQDFPNDRDAYNEGKTEYIKRITAIARGKEV